MRFQRLFCHVLLAIPFLACTVGCGESGPKPVVPNKPLLSAEEGKKNAEKVMKERLKAFEEKAKELKK